MLLENGICIMSWKHKSLSSAAEWLFSPIITETRLRHWSYFHYYKEVNSSQHPFSSPTGKLFLHWVNKVIFNSIKCLFGKPDYVCTKVPHASSWITASKIFSHDVSCLTNHVPHLHPTENWMLYHFPNPKIHRSWSSISVTSIIPLVWCSHIPAGTSDIWSCRHVMAAPSSSVVLSLLN